MGPGSGLALYRGSVGLVCGSARQFLRVSLVSITQSIALLVPFPCQLDFALTPIASCQHMKHGRPCQAALITWLTPTL